MADNSISLNTEQVPVLDEQICFALYSASRAITARYRDLLDPLGLTYPQYLVLLVLWETEPVTVSHLGERLHLDSGTLSPLLRRMESAGLLTRSRLPHDERSVQVSLTKRGSILRYEARGITDLVCAATGVGLADLQALREQVALLDGHVRDAL
ncbi:MarR family winged helix-turn-helix transcriptional regulator [Cryobacterium melibiosiphilum]|uniref:MarR family winged helix-turn-helix transcriptional regulator n=1 Tax=Cryobacterium melibiosiphilum TaxID=995039 RepID=UPI0018F7271E|nr:MarR family transcriptional regulator [Cryobacterium melibiosiphilum]